MPIQFFDTSYKHEELTEASLSYTKKVLDSNPRNSRIPQPYTLVEGGTETREDQDLFETLVKEYQKTLDPKHASAKIRVILGPAGIGKTWLFNAFFSELYEYFLKQKQALETYFRPIPLTPAYQEIINPRLDDIVNTFISAELAQQVTPSTLKWLLSEGYSTWLFDGLDELYAGDGSFFDQIEELVEENGVPNKAQILICARESLAVSSEAFSDFLLQHSNDGLVQVYRLDSWNTVSKKQFAGRNLKPKDAERFVTYISQSKTITDLSGLPYYCSVLLEEFKAGREYSFSNSFELMETMINHIIKRDVVEKGVLNLTDINEGDFEEWLGTVAYEFYSSNYQGVPKQTIEIYSDAILKAGLSESERKRALIALMQFPLFTMATKPDALAFEHELVAEFLTGKYLINRFTKSPKAITELLSNRQDFSDSLLFRYLAYKIPGLTGGVNKLVQEIKTPSKSETAYLNLLSLLLLSNPENPDIVKRNTIELEGRNLSHIFFINRDLSKSSFKDCNLTNTVFRQCVLNEVDFSNAIISGTRFEKQTSELMRGAKFGDLSKFNLCFIDNKQVTDRQVFKKWVEENAGQTGPIIEPCPTALQLKALLLKFISPDGRIKKGQMRRHALLTGRRVANAPRNEEILDESIRKGFFESIRWHDNIRIVPGEKRDDLVSFVSDWDVSKNLRGLLSDVCDIPDCVHVPRK